MYRYHRINILLIGRYASDRKRTLPVFIELKISIKKEKITLTEIGEKKYD
jgi:hypothetical protein